MNKLEGSGISWLIIGACTGTYQDMLSLFKGDKYPKLNVMRYRNKYTAQPKIEWVKEIVEAAGRAGVKVFLKDNLNPLLEGRATQDIVDMGLAMKHKTNASAWQLRQELPNSTE